MIRLLVIAILLSCLGRADAATPPDLSDLAFDQHPGTRLPLDAELADEGDRQVRLGDLFLGKPVVLAMGYFHCPNLCGVTRADVVAAMNGIDLTAGRDFSFIAISIDPLETGKDASRAKAADLALSTAANAGGWHYLTGESQAIAQAVGFQYRYDAELHQYMHPAGIVIVTADGHVARYLQGVGYRPSDLKMAMIEAGAGRIASPAARILLFCFHFDPVTGRYSLAIMNLLRVGAVLTTLMVGGLILVARRAERTRC